MKVKRPTFDYYYFPSLYIWRDVWKPRQESRRRKRMPQRMGLSVRWGVSSRLRADKWQKKVRKFSANLPVGERSLVFRRVGRKRPFRVTHFCLAGSLLAFVRRKEKAGERQHIFLIETALCCAKIPTKKIRLKLFQYEKYSKIHSSPYKKLFPSKSILNIGRLTYYLHCIKGLPVQCT